MNRHCEQRLQVSWQAAAAAAQVLVTCGRPKDPDPPKAQSPTELGVFSQ